MKESQKGVQYITKIVKLDTRFDILRFQLVLYKFINDIRLSDAEINAIAFLLDKGYYKGIFNDIVKEGWFKNPQCGRNCIRRAHKELNLLLDISDNYSINPISGITIDEYILVDLKVHNLESKE